MREIVISNDGIVSVREIVEEKTTTLSGLFDAIKNSKPFSTGMLPENTIFYYEEGNQKSFVLEERPGPRVISYETNRSRIRTHEAVISLPWIYWIITVHGGISAHVRCSKHRIRKLDDEVYLAPLLNFYDGGSSTLCTGNAISVEARDENAKKVNSFMSQVWSSVWQHDLSPALPFGIDTYDDFINLSYEEPQAWSSLQYRESRRSIEEII